MSRNIHIVKDTPKDAVSKRRQLRHFAPAERLGGQATERPRLRAADGEDFSAVTQRGPSAGREARRLAPLGPQE
jgi:hypothetical protein